MQKYVIKDEDDLAAIAQAVEEIAATKKRVNAMPAGAAAPPRGTAATSGGKAAPAAQQIPLPLLIGLGSIFLIGIIIAIVAVTSGAARTGKVPNVVGQKVAVAKGALGKEGLKVKIVFDESSTKPDGTVVAIDPAVGTPVHPHDAVTITLAGKGGLSITPPTINPDKDKPQVPIKTTNTQTPQNPVPTPPPPGPGQPPDTKHPKSDTDIPPPDHSTEGKIPMPEVKGLSEEKGKAKLTEAGLRVEVKNVTDTTQPNGTIVASEPEAGEKIEHGGLVHLQVNALPVVATPPAKTETPTVVLKDYVGASGKSAARELWQLGLKPEWSYEASGKYAPNTVLSSTPPAGSHVPLGSTVTLVLSQ